VTPARIPADVDRPDTVIGDLTARQAAILAAGLVAAWAAATLLRVWLPLPVALALASPLGLAAFAVVVARRDGLAGEQLVLAAVRHALAAKRLVAAPDGLPRLPAVAALLAGCSVPGVAALDLPLLGVCEDGVVDLGGDGSALLCTVSPVNFALRTADEQEALVAVFARFLHADLGGWQLVVATRPADPAPLAQRVAEAAVGLPHPALEMAARAHADHLRALAAERGLLTRQVVVVLHDPGPPCASAAGLLRRAEQAAALLAPAGVAVQVLDRLAAAAAVAAALRTYEPATDAPAVLTDEIVTRDRSLR